MTKTQLELANGTVITIEYPEDITDPEIEVSPIPSIEGCNNLLKALQEYVPALMHPHKRRGHYKIVTYWGEVLVKIF